MAPVIAIVGRPNVGKSTLFNRLVGRRLALVDDRPGVTRDRRESEARLGDLVFMAVDTAGLEDADDASLTGRMRAQTRTAIEAADAVLMLIDARAGILPSDREIAGFVRRSGKPVVLIANKAESRAGEQEALAGFELGLGDPVPFSAEHGLGLGDLHERLAAVLPQGVAGMARRPESSEGEQPRSRSLPRHKASSARAGPSTSTMPASGIDIDSAAHPLRVAIVGRPNVGKSTLINAMLGEERLLAGPEPGITRDAIGLDWAWQGRRFKVFDTAGLRKRARVDDKLEKLAAADGLRAVRFAEVVVLVLDAAIAFEKQDLSIASLVESEGRAIVIAVNKWDLVANKPGLLRRFREDARRLLPQLAGVGVIPVSGLALTGIDALMSAIVDAHLIWGTRIPTSKLNLWLADVVARHPPPAVSGRRIKPRYLTQIKARPPHFAIFGNKLNELPASYNRYLVNSLRQTFHLPGTPIRLSFRHGGNPYDRG
jgi:GTPase